MRTVYKDSQRVSILIAEKDFTARLVAVQNQLAAAVFILDKLCALIQLLGS